MDKLTRLRLVSLVLVISSIMGAVVLAVYGPNLLPLTPHPKREFSLRAFQFAYDPSVITVSLNDMVVLHIRSTDVLHGFGMREFGDNGIDVALPPDIEVTIEFIADKTGNFTFFCTRFCGSGHPNHKGTLIVA